MRVLIVAAALILIGSLIGWISFSKNADHTSINLETSEIRKDTSKVMESGAQLLHRAGDKMEGESVNQQKQVQHADSETAPVTR